VSIILLVNRLSYILDQETGTLSLTILKAYKILLGSNN
jgi:hypothetical protein